MSTLANVAMVSAGGALGAASRYGVSLLLAGPSVRFPYGTLLANLSGALLAGFLASLLLARGTPGSPAYLMLITGFFGSFTTLSAFSLDTLRLAHNGAMVLALLNITLTFAGALLAAAAGAWIASQWLGGYR